MYFTSSESNAIISAFIFLLVFVVIFTICMVIQGLSDVSKSNDKQRRRKRLESRKREWRRGSVTSDFDDYIAFEKMIGRPFDSEKTLPILPERFRVEIVQLNCTNDLAKGERTHRTKTIFFENRPYRYPGMFADCRV